jgi:hypothetical protein
MWIAIVGFSIAALGLIPGVSAAPMATFSPPTCDEPTCVGFSMSFTDSIDSNCPSGGFYSFTYTETPPSGPIFTGPEGPFSCGSTQFFAPTGPHPGGLECGTYNFEFDGTTSDVTGAPVATFDYHASLTVGCPTSVPEFGSTSAMVAAVSLLALVLLQVRAQRLKKPL